MRVGCCFTQWVRCIPTVIIADVAVIPEMPTENVSCEVKAVSVPRSEYCCSFLMVLTHCSDTRGPYAVSKRCRQGSIS